MPLKGMSWNHKSSAIELVMKRVRKTETCWIFEGPVRSIKNAYGVVKVGGRGGKVLYCHIISYKHYKGDVAEGLLVLHSCNNKRCVNPDHLYVGTHSTNSKQAFQDGLITMPQQKEGYIHPFAGRSLKPSSRRYYKNPLHKDT